MLTAATRSTRTDPVSLPVHVVPDLAGVGVGSEVSVEGDEAHHAVAVRRLRVGEQVVLTDGSGTSVQGPVASTGKRVFAMTVESVRVVDAPHPAVVVVQAIPKGDRGELAVEVLTEIGVAEIVPWAASRSVAVWKGERAAKSLARWRSTAREAAKQARRAWFPTVAALASTSDVAVVSVRVLFFVSGSTSSIIIDVTTLVRAVRLPVRSLRIIVSASIFDCD